MMPPQLLPRRLKACARAFALGGLAFACGAQEPAPPSDEPAPLGDLTCPGEPLSPAPLRRLTRFEYANAVADVFGADLALEELFPRDEVALGFDNQAATLSLTDLHVEAYLKAGTTVAEWVAADPERIRSIAGCADETLECAQAFSVELALRLQRRPLPAPELDALMELFAGDFSPEGFRDGASKVVTALLQNPRFLYRIERNAGDFDAEGRPAAAKALASPWALASRLSFLFWGSVPDAELFDAAAAGRLATPDDVQREARRLLDDPRARRGVLHFYLQWLDLSDYSETEKDRQLFSIWSETLRADLGRETARFIEGVLESDDARFETLLTAPYTFANALLSDFYGLPITDPDQRELARVDFGPGIPRLGLLSQGAILSRQAKPNQTDPIHRGKFIRTQFFCQIPPPPPPDLVVSPPRLDPRKTTRERFEEHRAEPSCATCHRQLDPIGLAFEHYDAIGRYRATESGLPVDATGHLYDTDVDGPIDGLPDLVSKLTESAQVRSCVVKQWFRYAFGRGEAETDRCALDKLERVFQASRGNLRELMVALTQVDAFLRPAPPPAEEEP